MVGGGKKRIISSSFKVEKFAGCWGRVAGGHQSQIKKTRGIDLD